MCLVYIPAVCVWCRERDEALAWLSSLRERLAERREKELSTDQHIQSLTGHVKVFTEENQQVFRKTTLSAFLLFCVLHSHIVM